MSTTNRPIVYIIGAGPGDPGLITVRGLQCLASADVVLYDRLVPLFRLESKFRLPFGMSLIAIAQKPPQAGARPSLASV